MRSTRRAATAAVSVSLALTGVAATAHADSTNVLYVNGSSSACTDSGTGTAAAPYCTIQAAANAAVAGDTVDIAAGSYTGQVDVKSQGTAAAPIVFQPEGGSVAIEDATGQTGAALTLDGAQYVSFEGQTWDTFITYGTDVTGSSDITLNRITGNSSVIVSGTSSNVTLTRSAVTAVQIGSGSSGDVISTNYVVDESATAGISVAGASNTDITSNNVVDAASYSNAISVTGSSTGISIENNIVAYPRNITTQAAVASVEVDASSAPGTTLDYNVVYPTVNGSAVVAQVPYSWAGTEYSSAAALSAATGEGSHDLNTNPTAYLYSHSESAPQIDSANSNAPGMLSTDIYGNACSVDQLVAATGAGTPDYCSRGALQEHYTTSVTATATATSALSTDLSSSIAQTASWLNGIQTAVTAAATPQVSYTINWGDGQSQTVQASSTAAATSTAHTYAKSGTYTITDTATLADGSTESTTTSVTTAGSDFTSLTPKRIMDTRSGVGGFNGSIPSGTCYGLKVAGVDGVPSNATAVALNLTVTGTVSNGLFYIGSGTASNLNYNAGQTVANSAIVPLDSDGGIAVCSSGDSNASADAIIDVTGYFSRATGNGYQPTTLDRILDTRSGTGAAKAKVAAKSSLSVQITGEDSIPADATAVAVHVTETNATGSGYIAVVPGGTSGVPTTSSLNYGKGQTVSNTVIVPVSDGKIELYNGAVSGSVDLIADVSGYFDGSAAQAFVPVTAFRSVDTRQTGNGLGSDGSETFPLNSVLATTLVGFPANATVAANLTATEETAGGSVIVYPAGTAQPNVSALNYGKGLNIASFGLFTTTGVADAVNVYNDSPGSTQLVVDVFGYFSAS
ncbi:right-handed parallel beta-helix repeat-containing protein [Actinospica sp. MGRD01-02]|uniref:Right-handed parallel beta-helix repeat-containing protein n=1 Tax=Actinospica acidithermotolerans TaxID=2828514 RepID=A0A941EBC0_9ACTN|nr:right-handed parallel beta-helix repeat-containing protein [Actinospica acidithermotolerans]MBR7824749.1 right-handed parallel beta-helix repeat-containing protein [Actinospica acidithermotolerans]